MGNIVVFCLCLLSAFVPFEGLGYLEDLPSIARLLGLAVLASAVLAVTSGHRLRLLGAVPLMQIVFVAWSALSILWAFDQKQSLGTFTRLLLNLGLAILVWEFAVTYRQQLAILRSFMVGLLVPMSLEFAEVFGFYHMSISDASMESVRFTGGGNDMNYLAMILALGIVLAAYFATASSGLDRWLRPFYWTFAALAAVAAMLTASRAGFVCLLLAAIFAAFLAGVSRRNIIRSVAVIVFIFFVVVLVRYIVPQALQERAAGLTEESSTFGPRWGIWERGLTVTFPRTPLAGVGVGGYGAATSSLTGVKTGTAQQHAHPDPRGIGRRGTSAVPCLVLYGVPGDLGLAATREIPLAGHVLGLVRGIDDADFDHR